MRKAAYIPKEGWKDFVASLAGRAEVYAPVRDGGTVTFRRIGAGQEPCLDEPAAGAPKAVIYPQSQTLFTFDFRKDPAKPGKTEVELNAPADAPEAIILCGRPCDARGFAIIDRAFLGVDPYYTARREQTTLITLTCNRPYAGCFCTSVGGGPADEAGSDVLLTDLGHGYYAEALTDKGEKALEGTALPDGLPYGKEAQEQKAAATQAVKPVFSDGAKPTEAPDAYWEGVSQKCLGCGACTYLCPTCYCFNITDEHSVGAAGRRVRSWDSCMFAHFTKEASGHNPRAQKSKRLRNRIAHKFTHYPEKYGEPACTGCGRCIRLCPVSMDISGIVAALAAARP